MMGSVFYIRFALCGIGVVYFLVCVIGAGGITRMWKGLMEFINCLLLQETVVVFIVE